MLLSLPDHSTLYAALLQRSPDYKGRTDVGVTSTGIFCRLKCGACKTKSHNCHFFAVYRSVLPQVSGLVSAVGLLHRLDQIDSAILRLLDLLDAQLMHRWNQATLAQMGFDPSAVRRTFKRHFGATCLQLARWRRLQMGLRALANGDKVIEAQLMAGFASPSAFRLAFAQLLGQALGSLSQGAVLKASCIDTPLGPMLAVADAQALHLLEFINRRALRGVLARLRSRTGSALGLGCPEPMAQLEAELTQYFDGKRAQFECLWQNTAALLHAIPAGQTQSYGAIAAGLGRSGAARAVAVGN